jgi:hypothetical protein
LRSDGERDIVSYYAGDEEPQIRQGAVLYDFARVASRRVVCSVDCSLGLDEQEHRVAVIATCVKLAVADEKLVVETAGMLSQACDQRQRRELMR